MVFVHLNFSVNQNLIQKLTTCQPGAIEFVLFRLRQKIDEAVQEGRFRPSRHRSRSFASRSMILWFSRAMSHYADIKHDRKNLIYHAKLTWITCMVDRIMAAFIARIIGWPFSLRQGNVNYHSQIIWRWGIFSDSSWLCFSFLISMLCAYEAPAYAFHAWALCKVVCGKLPQR